MKNQIKHPLHFFTLLVIAIFFLNSCAPPIVLNSSWTNKTAKVKPAPLIMVMTLGNDLAARQAVESYMVADLKKLGHNAISALDVFKPEMQKVDSATLVNMLRQNKVDMLLTNAVVNVTEKDRYVPGTTQQVPVGSYATPANPYHNGYNNYNGGYNVGQYNNYYNNYNSYQTIYETQTTPGYTVTDVEVLIESNLYDVAKPELLWYGQSKSYTKDPSIELFKEFSKLVIDDISKSNLLVK
jgi:hypothetical protein